MSGSEPLAPSEPDLRLLPVVAPLWLAQTVILLWRPSAPLPVAALGAIVALIALTLGAVAAARLRAPRVNPVSRSHASVVLAVGCGLGLGLVVGGAHLARLHPPLLEQVAADGAVVRAVVRVTGDPEAHLAADDGGRSSGPRWSVGGRLAHVAVRGQALATSVPVLVRGDAVQHLRYGAVVEVTARAGRAWAPQSHAAELRVLGPARVRSPPGLVARATTTIRERFRAACSDLPVDAAALLMGLAIGDESLLPPDLGDAMVRAGLAHLTAVSGSNTSLVVGIALAAAVGLGVGWRARVGWCLLVLGAYVALVRPQPSVLRAAAMGLVALLALTTGGRRRGPPALLAAVLVLLVARPEFAVSLGFALSVAATAGLLVVGPPLAERLGRWPVSRAFPEPVRVALAVAAAAHLATLPLAILMGNGASLVALPANVLVTPLVPIATVLGLAAALIAPIALGPASALAQLAAPATGTIAWISRTAAGAPHGVVPVTAGPGAALSAAAVLALVGLAAARGWRPWRDRRALGVACLLATVAAILRTGWDARWPPPEWQVLACDVGQGDAVMVRARGATEALLVDVGPADAGIAECVGDAGVRRLVVLLTHFHADHVDGLAAVLDRWPVDGILTTAVPEPPDGAAAVLASASADGVPVRTLRAGDRVVAAGIGLSVLWPARRIPESPANNGSVVAVAEVPTGTGPLRVLLTGDVEPEAQTVLLAGPAPDVDVVKVPHHGSPHQVPHFATWTGASVALVSVGRDNDYGHPSQGTLQQYRGAGALVGRTDEQGPLAVVLLDGRAALVARR